MNTIEEWAAMYSIPPVALAALKHLHLHNVTPGTPGASEANAQALIRLEAPNHGALILRNNNGACLDDTGRQIRYGLGNDSKKINDKWKSSDLIGITPVTYHGHTFGVFTACEVKRPGWKKPANARDNAQLAFLTTIKSYGGIAMFATSPEDFKRGLVI